MKLAQIFHTIVKDYDNADFMANSARVMIIHEHNSVISDLQFSVDDLYAV